MSKILSLPVVALVLLFSALPAAGQQIGFLTSEQRVDSLRADLLHLNQKALERTSSPAAREQLLVAQRDLELASEAELAEIYGLAGPYIARFRDVVDSHDALLAELRDQLTPRSAGLPEALYPTGPNAATFDGILDVGDLTLPNNSTKPSGLEFVLSVICTEIDAASGLSTGPQTDRVLYQLRFNAKQALLLAELIRDILGRLCDQEFQILGTGGDLSLACIPVDIAFHLARPLEEFPAICDGLINSAEIEGAYERLGHFHGDLETAQSSIDDVDGDLRSHDAALGVHNTEILTALDGAATSITDTVAANLVAIQQALAAHEANVLATLSDRDAFFLRTFVERALRREAGNGGSTPPSVVYRLATLYLPPAHGGNLDVVKQVVEKTIADIEAAGENSNDAGRLFDRAVAAESAGAFKEAWDHYAAAYLEALRCDRRNRACR